MSQTKPAFAWRLPRRVAYVVNHSFPYSSDGYAVRTHEVASALNGLGHEVIVINRPGRPWDIQGFDLSSLVRTEQVIDGVRYIFLPNAVSAEMNRRDRLRQAERVLYEAFEVFRPAAVIGVSNWENAEPAQYAARRWGVPFYYEQRGFWEMSRAAHEPGYETTEDFRRDSANELAVAQAAQGVFVLSTAMAEELVRRGVPQAKIQLVANGVGKPYPIVKKVSRADIGSRARYLLGYMGSLNPYEGPEDLLTLLSILRRDGVDADLMIVGSSSSMGLIGSGVVTPTEVQMKARVVSLNLQDHVHFTPQISQSEMGAYYSIVDAVIMPRHRIPVTELVAPLKPYAAAAYGVPVFMTDLAPLREVAKDIHGSLFPAGDTEALAAMVRHTLEHGGHPAVLNPLSPDLSWQRRVQPMSQALNTAAGPALKTLVAAFGAPGPAPAAAAAQKPEPEAAPRFDIRILPQVALRGNTGAEVVAALGPCADLPEKARVIRLSRASLLSVLATEEAGRFVIDWAGLQAAPGEWQGLWSIDNMRLNRQIMDACSIARDRGWRLEVLGPVLRSKAPLFSTVAGVLEEIRPQARERAEGENT